MSSYFFKCWDISPFYVKCCIISMSLLGIFLNPKHYDELKNSSNYFTALIIF